MYIEGYHFTNVDKLETYRQQQTGIHTDLRRQFGICTRSVRVKLLLYDKRYDFSHRTLHRSVQLCDRL